MNIFKKIFANSDPSGKNSGLNKPDIDKLLNSEDVNRSIIELDNYICALCEYGEELNKLTEQQRIFFFNQNLEREVNNGGFDQFYKNSSGNFANETIDSLKAIGAYKTAEIVKKANDQFPEKNVPEDRIKRLEIM